MKKQPLEIQTLYSELTERLVAYEAARAIGYARGTFVTKTIKGNVYYYFQHSEPGGGKRQLYIGPKDANLDRVVEAYGVSKEILSTEVDSIERLCTLLRAGDALVTDAPSARVLRGLSDAGVFHIGGVLVGTHAYTVLGNVLGVSWSGTALRTQDVDVAAHKTLEVAVDSSASVSVPDALESLRMGFLPVPGLDPSSASTSFKVRGQGLRVDLLTPVRGDHTEQPVRVERLGAAAQPLRFLDYLIDGPVRGAVVNGGGILVNVPRPARFAIHKLILASERPVTTHVKRGKDLAQAAEVLGTLVEERPGDVGQAWRDLLEYGRSYVRRAQQGLAALEKRDAGVAEQVQAEIGA